jgi:tetratricopeptide (TPR) repeat protein
MIKFLLTIIVLIVNNNSLAHVKISNLVEPVSYFVNHVKQLALLKSNLAKYRQVSIVGTSGFGKTQLVRMYAYENKNNYDLIWFIDCNLDINKEFLKFAKQLNRISQAGISEDADLVKKEVMIYLAHQDKWLLVFDNLKINENKKIKDLVDWEHNGDVIFCSQDSEMLPHTVEMACFEQSDTINLISNLLENSDRRSIEFLTEEFKGYPVLIVQGTQLLNKMKGLSREEYKKKIYKSADKIKLNISLAMQQLNPSALNLLKKIALMNNQSFSKQLLTIITDDPNTLDEDIFQLSKFALISNVDFDNGSPVFEAHDVIAQKVTEINGERNNKVYLEEIITKLVNSIPKSVIKGRILRNSNTIQENLEMIERNATKYNVNIYKLMELNLELITQYMNSLDYRNAEKKVNWFNKNDQEGKFKLWLMNNEEKTMYAGYFGLIGGYYSKCSNYITAIKYYTKAKKIFAYVKGYEDFKCNVAYCLAVANIILGKIQEAEENIQVIEDMFSNKLIDSTTTSTLLYFVKARLFFVQGKYSESLEEINKSTEIVLKNGLSPNDLFLTNTYVLKAWALNSLGRYEEAYAQVQQLYEMHKLVKKESHEVFGRIYIQMAKSELGLGKIKEALEHVTKSIAIFLSDEQRNPKEADYSEDTDLALSYVVQGDIFFFQDNLIQTIEFYKKAQNIYFYVYRDRSKNVAHISYLYTQGAKAACRMKSLYDYKIFGKLQVKEFGIDHPNTAAMFEFCKPYNMDLWSKEN